MPPDVTPRTVHMPGAAWTVRSVTCDPGAMSVTDPLLVVRRHVDLLRVQSAICLLAR
ncbi:MAG: putative leader peptide [Streptosporangiaceae bacterium]